MYSSITETLFQASRDLQIQMEVNEELPVVVRHRLNTVVDAMDDLRHQLDNDEVQCSENSSTEIEDMRPVRPRPS